MKLPILKYLKFIYNSVFYKPKYVLKGECKKCGKCCKNIVFFAYNIPIKEEIVFEELKQKNKRMNLFYPNGKNEHGELLFRCKFLDDNNRCKVYFFRSFYCRKYPMVKSLLNGKLLTPREDCGYKIEPVKKFEDFLK